MHRLASKLWILALFVGGCSTTSTARLGLPELQTVRSVDLSRYVGTWYELASFPQSFQRGCVDTTATYTLRADGDIGVLNRCVKPMYGAKPSSIEGRARVVDAATRAKLEVSFFPPFWGDYWIVDLGRNYEYAVVGHPSRDYLWILAREPRMRSSVYRGIVERLRAQGYETKRLVRTRHGRRE